jgi:hypothetical protein
MSRLTIIYFLSFFLLSWCFHQERSFKFEKQSFISKFVSQKKRELRPFFENDSLIDLCSLYLIGLPRRIPADIKKAHTILGMNHLFTPSGLHLTAVISSLGIFFFMFRKRKRPIKICTEIAICLSLFTLPGFSALKRMGLIRLIYLALSRFADVTEYSAAFGVAMTLDLCFGSFATSPLSFSYSFLFLGALLTMRGRGWSGMILGLMGAMVIVNFFQGNLLYPFGSFANFLLTPLFSLFFTPMTLLYFLPTFSLPAFCLEKLMALYWILITHASESANALGGFECTLPAVISVLILSLRIRLSVKTAVVALCLLFSSPSLKNWDETMKKRMPPMKYLVGPPKGLIIAHQEGEGTSSNVEFTNGDECRFSFEETYLKIKCRRP